MAVQKYLVRLRCGETCGKMIAEHSAKGKISTFPFKKLRKELLRGLDFKGRKLTII